MPRPRNGERQARTRQRDILEVTSRAEDMDASMRPSASGWPPLPDLFDVITYFRARGDSFTLTASIGFWIGEGEWHCRACPWIGKDELAGFQRYLRRIAASGRRLGAHH